jgi:hypothetical protein
MKKSTARESEGGCARFSFVLDDLTDFSEAKILAPDSVIFTVRGIEA